MLLKCFTLKRLQKMMQNVEYVDLGLGLELGLGLGLGVRVRVRVFANVLCYM